MGILGLFGIGKKKAVISKPKIKIDVDVIQDDLINKALESLNAPFYRVCTKAKKGYSWRRMSSSCNPDYINAYAATEDDVSKYLHNIFNIKLKDFIADPEKYMKAHDKAPKIDIAESEAKETIAELFERIKTRLSEATYE